MPCGLTLLGRARREAPAQTELRPTCAGASSAASPIRSTPSNKSCLFGLWLAATRPYGFLPASGNGCRMPCGLTLLGRATLEAPAQTELRPTCAGAFSAASPMRSIPSNKSCLFGLWLSATRPYGFLPASGKGRRMPWGLTLPGRTRREAPAQTELRPTCARASITLHFYQRWSAPVLVSRTLPKAPPYFLAKTLHNIYLSRQRWRRSVDVEKRR